MDTFIPNRSTGRIKGARSGGFTYVALLIVLAIMGIASTAALQFGTATHRRMAEESLLNVGGEFSRALDSYRRLTPRGQSGSPLELEDLLRDPRFPGVVRHLRKLYYDPLTGRQEWGVLRSEDSRRIIGIFSLSDAQPVKTANFDSRFRDFAGKTSYQQWVFTGALAEATGDGLPPNSIDPRTLMQPDSTAPLPPPLPEGQLDPRSLMR